MLQINTCLSLLTYSLIANAAKTLGIRLKKVVKTSFSTMKQQKPTFPFSEFGVGAVRLSENQKSKFPLVCSVLWQQFL